MRYDRKLLWKDIQLYVRSTGIIIKKLPVTLLKEYKTLRDTDAGTETAEYLRDMFADFDVNVCDLAGGDNQLKDYCEEVLANHMWSKNANVYLAFKVAETERTVKPLRLVGMLATGTFRPDRYDARGDYEVTMPGGTKDTAELEMVLAAAHAGAGRALALWGIGDLLMRSSQGRRKYTQIIAFTKPRMATLLRSYGFTQKRTHEKRGNRSTASKEIAYTLPNTEASARGILAQMRVERGGLFELCGLRGMRLWQNCR